MNMRTRFLSILAMVVAMFGSILVAAPAAQAHVSRCKMIASVPTDLGGGIYGEGGVSCSPTAHNTSVTGSIEIFKSIRGRKDRIVGRSNPKTGGGPGKRVDFFALAPCSYGEGDYYVKTSYYAEGPEGRSVTRSKKGFKNQVCNED